MTLAGVDVVVTADLERGVKTNRVRARRRPGPKPRPLSELKRPDLRFKRPKRYRKDASVKGRPYTKICVSLPIDELAAVDAMADRVQMARSEFLRQAAKHFIAKVAP